ncbi:T9SS type A sorting domain-containing protein [Bacteroidota bacterium]
MKLLAAFLLILISFTCFQLTAQENNNEKFSGNLKNQNPKIQSLDTLPPEPEWMLCRRGVNVCRKGYVYDRPDIPSIRSNLMSIILNEELSYNFKLSYGYFMPCYDSFTDWKLELIEYGEDALGVVTFSDCAGNDTTLYIEFNAVKLRIVPKKYDFGKHSIGETSEQIFYVENYSETSTASLSYLMLKLKDGVSSPQGFTLWDSTGTYQSPTEFNPPVEIEPLDSMPFLIKFDANEQGEFWDSIGLGDTCFFRYESYVQAEVGVTGIRNDYKMINLFPNPVDEIIIISGINEGDILLKIIDILGNEIYSEKILITNDQLLINTKEFPEGMYLIQLITGKEIITRKFVVFH